MADPYYAYRSLILNFNGSDGDTSNFTDGGPLGLVHSNVRNAPELDTTSPVFGSACCYFPGDSAIRWAPHAAFGFGTAPFAMEGRLKTTGGTMTLASTFTSGDSSTVHVYCAGNTIRFYTQGGDRITGSITVNDGTWHDWKLIKSADGYTRLFIDGYPQGSPYADTNDYGSSKQFVLGGYDNIASSSFTGHMDAFRITKGIEVDSDVAGAEWDEEAAILLQVSGVLIASGDPIEATVRLYDRATGALLDETTSDESTGAYTLTTYEAGELQVVALDIDDASLENDMIHRVFGVEPP